MKYCNDWEMAQKRYLAWWNGEIIDRVPIFIIIRDDAAINRKKEELLNKKALSLEQRWTDTEFLVKIARTTIENSFFIGEAFPSYYPNIGPDIFSGFLGANIRFAENTSWSEPFIEDLSKRNEFIFDPQNKWWKKLEEITEAVVEDSKGEFFVGITDLHPGIDALSALRGPENLCIDMLENPELVKQAAREIFNVWKTVYDHSFEMTNKYVKGSTTWMRIWHPDKWYPVSCDFICMISPEMFEEFVLPALLMEIESLNNSMFHLDGPGALKHLDMLLDIPRLNGIQWVPGAGQPSGAHWTDLLKKIQTARKLVHINIPSHEVEKVIEELSPRGLFIVTRVDTLEEGRQLLDRVTKISFKKKLF